MNSEDDLKKQNEFFNLKITQFTIDHAPMSVFWLNKEAEVTYVNEQACQSLGYTKEELLNLKLYDFDPVFTQERWDKNWASYKKDSVDSLYIETLHKRKDGTTFPVEIFARHIWFGDTELHVSFSNDISERLKVRKNILDSEAKLKEANATKDKFFSIISHDLRNPFNTIIGYSDLLKSNYYDYNNEERLKIVSEINNAANHTFSLLDNLLSWSRTQLGHIEIKSENINLQKIVEASIDPYLAPAAEKKITVENLVSDIPRIYCDYDTIRTVIGNIFNNAVKFTNRNGKITIEAALCSNNVCLDITDTGIGMEKSEIEKLFKLGECKSSLGTEAEKGTGLGLVLCKEFVEKNDGKIVIESEPGKGSKFRIILPSMKIN